MCSSTTCGRGPSRSWRRPRTTTGWLTAARAATSRRSPRREELVVDLVGTEQLDHDGRVGHLVEGQPRLVGRSPAELAHRGQLLGDRVALGELPALLLASHADQRRVSLRLRSLVLLADQSRFLSPAPSLGPVAGLVAAAVVAVAAHRADAAVGVVVGLAAPRAACHRRPPLVLSSSLVSSSSSSATRTSSTASSSRLSASSALTAGACMPIRPIAVSAGDAEQRGGDELLHRGSSRREPVAPVD